MLLFLLTMSVEAAYPETGEKHSKSFRCTTGYYL